MRVAVVGLGHLGVHHARIYSDLPDVQLVGVVDTDERKADEVSRGLGVKGYTDWTALPPEVEAVSLAVPTALHSSLGMGILDSGRDLLVEKPISATLEEADRLIETARRTGRLLMVGHTERFNPAVTVLRREVTEPRFVEIQRLASFVPRGLDVDVVLDLMIHDLDLLLLLAGPEVEDIQAIGVNAFTGKVDIANARIRFASGCVANLTASRISRERVRKLRVFQARSYLSLDYAAQKVVCSRLRPAGTSPSVVQEVLPVEREEPLRRQLRSFLEAVRRRQPPACTGEEAKRALGLAFRILGKMGT